MWFSGATLNWHEKMLRLRQILGWYFFALNSLATWGNREIRIVALHLYKEKSEKFRTFYSYLWENCLIGGLSFVFVFADFPIIRWLPPGLVRMTIACFCFLPPDPSSLVSISKNFAFPSGASCFLGRFDILNWGEDCGRVPAKQMLTSASKCKLIALRILTTCASHSSYLIYSHLYILVTW